MLIGNFVRDDSMQWINLRQMRSKKKKTNRENETEI